MGKILNTSLAVFLLVGNSVQSAAQDSLQSASGPATARKQKMEEARQFALSGREYILNTQGESEESSNVYVFYNNPHPLCYSYIIPGMWTYSPGESAYRSKDGRSIVSVDFMLNSQLKTVEGSTVLERLKNFITSAYEAQLGQRLSNVEVTTFDSARPGTWKWHASPVTVQGGQHDIPPKIFVALDTIGYATLTVVGTTDDDAVLRRILGSMKTTHATDCYWTELEAVLKSIYPD